FPCWPFDKLSTADRRLGTQMKATGEVMAIEKTVAAGLQKAIRSLELDVQGLSLQKIATKSTEQLRKLVLNTDDRRFFAILELMRRGYDVPAIRNATKIDAYFLQEMWKLVQLEVEAQQTTIKSVTLDQMVELKQAGFTNAWLANAWECSIKEIDAKL